MNTYLIQMNEGTGPYIKKIVANSEQTAKEKLYKQLYDKYEFVEGDTLDEIQGQLSEEGIDIGQIYDIDEFM